MHNPEQPVYWSHNISSASIQSHDVGINVDTTLFDAEWLLEINT